MEEDKIMTKDDIQDAIKLITEQILEHHKAIESIQNVLHKMNDVFIEIQKMLNE